MGSQPVRPLNAWMGSNPTSRICMHGDIEGERSLINSWWTCRKNNWSYGQWTLAAVIVNPNCYVRIAQPCSVHICFLIHLASSCQYYAYLTNRNQQLSGYSIHLSLRSGATVRDKIDNGTMIQDFH